MITIKTPQEIAILREGGHLLARALEQVARAVRPGITMKELDEIAHNYLVEHGGTPSFLGYGGSRHTPAFPASLCVSVNDEVVHGVGTRALPLSEGDIVGLDIGVRYPAKGGLFTDMAVTVGVGEITPKMCNLIETAKGALEAAIALVKPGIATTDLSKVIQDYGESRGYSLVRDLTGHGVGHKVHEEPPIFCYYDSRMPRTILKEGMVICIEPMVNMGTWRVTTDADGWTIRTADKSLSAHFEHTIAVTAEGHVVLTV